MRIYEELFIIRPDLRTGERDHHAATVDKAKMGHAALPRVSTTKGNTILAIQKYGEEIERRLPVADALKVHHCSSVFEN